MDEMRYKEGMELPTPQDSARPEIRVTAGSTSAVDNRVPELRLWGIRRTIALAVAAALLLVSGLIVAALWYAGWPGYKRDATVTAATMFDLLKLVFAVVAGIGGVAALVVAYRRQRVAEHTNALAEFAQQLAYAADVRAEVSKALAEAADERAKTETDRNGVRLFNERFAKASEQLGSEKAAVRLAGVYAMAVLADDWREGRQTCIDVLCAYLRMPYTPPPDFSNGTPEQDEDQAPIVDADTARLAREEREVRHTVIRLVSRHLRLAEDDATSWGAYDFDFTGAVFDGGDFSGVAFRGGDVSFSEATFCAGGVFFSRATFSGGEVSFEEAKFCGGEVSFLEAAFCGGRVFFSGARFSGGDVSFSGATFSSGLVCFRGAEFSGGEVSFADAKFSDAADVAFLFATFSGGEVSFSGATFCGGGVSFSGAMFSSGEVSFPFATFSGGKVSFAKAMFKGAAVSFFAATFDGGRVSFEGASAQVPPVFGDWADGPPPAGLILPGA
ncbi:hypothetical protein AB0283_15670 [Micromonospora vinacea]|uniref:pentapeptide repeat-containing protein n=1 Tax=Micromonospora vinacea TaxID=709878 RepID=UPI0034503E21